jgi:hypothetical protein
MSLPAPHRSHRPKLLLRRLDRAAAAMNPALALVMFGLVIINVISIAALAWSGRVTRYGDTAVERCLRTVQQDIDPIQPHP